MAHTKSSNTNFRAMKRIGYLLNFIYSLGYIVRFFHQLFYILKCQLNKLRGLETVTKIVWSDNEILNCSAVRLSRMIRSRSVTSELVVQTFIDRINEVNPVINAVVCDNFVQALKRAREIDAYLDGPTESFPSDLSPENAPLVGVPCSIKMSIFVTDMVNDVGVWCRRGRVASRDADVVVRLRKAGAIPLAVTNTSEFCFFWDSCNKVHGATNNPYNTQHTSGGSSSGEGALVAAQGSPFGIGTDGGGSIRMPAYFTGVYGHKCSPDMVSNDGQFPHIEDTRISITTGPLCRYPEDIGPVMRVISYSPFPEWSEIDASKLKIYYLLEPNISLSSSIDPVITERTRSLIDTLTTKCSMHVEPYDNKLFQWSLPIWTGTNLMHGDPSIDKQLLINDPTSKRINFGWELLKSFVCAANFNMFTNILALSQRRTKFNSNAGFNHKMYNVGQKLKQQLEDLLGDNGVLLFPSHPTTAPRHNMPQVMPTNFSFTAVFNAILMPVTQIPLGLSPDGLPLGVQLVAKQGNDHLTIALAEYISEVTKVGCTLPTVKMKKFSKKHKIRILLLSSLIIIVLILIGLSIAHEYPKQTAHFKRLVYLLYSKVIGDIAKRPITTNLSASDRLIFESCAPFYKEDHKVVKRVCPRNMRFRPANKANDVTALISFPGSGNTWMRQIMEEATGIYTGAIYCDEDLKRAGFLGEYLTSNAVIAIKTHLTDNRLINGKSGKSFDSVIFLTRNPYDAIIAEANREWTEDHTKVAQIEKFKDLKNWSEFVSKMSKIWEMTVRTWLQEDKPLLIVRYEDLKSDLLNQLKRILTFLKVPYTEDQLHCVLKANLDTFKRKNGSENEEKYKKYYYTDELVQYVNSTIENVRPILNKFSIFYL
ncbi:Fatty-acid amide hydrolase 2 [Oopsacas minuta]|uniref:Fatty-acid amide hydrolase 2 n=1 Tax=Oopsacas minuta TaxID=111878 RepID=A0AAV7KD75_9METZ|nr:Fatty-acid amide hydrolase 2 [Oopsacas minuta]